MASKHQPDAAMALASVANSAAASASVGNAPSSPHLPVLQAMPQLPANKNSNKMTPVLSPGSAQAASNNVYFPPSSPGIMNKPPLVLAKPEEGGASAGSGDQQQTGKGNDSVFIGQAASPADRRLVSVIYDVSYNLYGILSFLLTVILGLLFSIRCPSPEEPSSSDVRRASLNLTTTLDPRLIHPLARRICCKCCTKRIAKPENAIRISMKKRQSLMAAASSSADIEDYHAALHRQQQHGQGRPGRIGSGGSPGSPLSGSASFDHGLSRRCSRHSHMSKRSSLGSNNVTTAEVLVTAYASSPANSALIDAGSQDVRRLSQLSDHEVEAAIASRRNSGSSNLHRRVSPQMSLSIPAAAIPSVLYPSTSPAALSPALSSHLAPPSDEELLAQRRFSEVNAAIERHNSRRQAKRSQSVMYRPQRRAARRRSTEIIDMTAQQQQPMLQPNMQNVQANMGSQSDDRVWRLNPSSSSLKPQVPLHATLSAPPLQAQQYGQIQ